MRDRIHFDSTKFGKRWVCYFDLLGFSKIATDSLGDAFDKVERCLSEANQNSFYHKKLERAWFSDTFVFYAPDNSIASFHAIEFVSKNFFEMAVRQNIPLRGAMSCEQFYADKANGVFVGKALVEAFKFGEKLSWIGFVLCQSAIKRMGELKISADQRPYYKNWSAPVKDANPNKTADVIALLFGSTITDDGKNSLIPVLVKMLAEADSEVKEKYENSLKFLNHYGVPQSNPQNGD